MSSIKKGFQAPVLKKPENKEEKTGNSNGSNKSEKSKKKIEKSLTDSQYDDLFEAVLSHGKSDPESQHNVGPRQEDSAENENIETLVKRKGDSQKVQNSPSSQEQDHLDTPTKKPKESGSETPKSQQKSLSQASVWGSHFRKNSSQVSSLLKDYQETQKSLAASNSQLSSETTSSSSDNEEDGGSVLLGQCSQISGFGSQSQPNITTAPATVISTNQRKRLEYLQQCRNVGVWVYCCRPSCQKQRYLATVTDPQDVPEIWYCHMNPDPNYNHCQAEEQKLSEEEEEDMIFNEFTAGSVVWARVAGYPWWPAMVDDDPDLEQFYWLEDDLMTVTYYHVVFFDEASVTRAWVSLKNITSYYRNENKFKMATARGLDYRRRIMVAKEQANDAVTLTTVMRLKIYSFIARYKGPITTSASKVKRTMDKYKLKVEVVKPSNLELKSSSKKEKRTTKKKSVKKVGPKENVNDSKKDVEKKKKENQFNHSEKKVNLKDSNKAKLSIEAQKEFDKKYLKRKQEELSDSELSVPIKKRSKSLFEKKLEKLVKKRKPRSDAKKEPLKPKTNSLLLTTTNKKKDKGKTSENTKQESDVIAPKTVKKSQDPTGKNIIITDINKQTELKKCEDKSVDSVDTKVSSPKPNKSLKSNCDRVYSQNEILVEESVQQVIKETCIEEAPKETSNETSLFLDTSKVELNSVSQKMNLQKVVYPQPSTSAQVSSKTLSGLADDPYKKLLKEMKNLERTEDSFGSFVEPSQAQVVERDDLLEEKNSQSTIADFLANLSEDAVVPEATLSQLSEPFEE